MRWRRCQECSVSVKVGTVKSAGATVLDSQSRSRLIYDGEENACRVQGNAVNLRLEDGSELRAQVNMRQDDGRITELMINGKLWATSLCE